MRLLSLMLLLPAFCLCPHISRGQMLVGTDTLYGNEWIDYARTYYKIKVADDGIYRIPAATLQAAGIPVGSIPAEQYRLYHNGRQEPVFVSTSAVLGPQDFIEFYGEKNRDELDRHLFEKPDAENLNPWYSLFNDTSAYYLVWETRGTPLRYTVLENDLRNLPAKEPYCWYTERQVFSAAHLKRRISNEITYSWFNGEGFGAARAVQSQFDLKLTKLLTGGPVTTIGIRYACELGQHRQLLTINDSLTATDAFPGWKVVDRQVGKILRNETVKIQLNGLASANDWHHVAGCWARYPRAFDFDNAAWAAFELNASTAVKYLEISDLARSTAPYVIYDLSNRRRQSVNAEGNILKINVGSSSLPRRMVVAGTGVRTVGSVRAVQFRDYRGENATYIILSNKALYRDRNGSNPVADYAAYRSSPVGGGHKVAVVEINELYEQFGYGVRFHPIAMRNFCHYVKKVWAKPEYLFLIGKGLHYETFRTSAQQTDGEQKFFFVPTYGSPGADWPFVMQKAKNSNPLFSVGRIAVIKPEEISHYLDKVREHDRELAQASQTIEGRAWMKRALHISGGQNPGETNLLRDYTASLSNTIRNNKMGANVETLYKSSNDPIQSSSYEELRRIIGQGASVWTIFGHSSPFIVDFDIGLPDAYKNAPRYPLMLVLGCFSGVATSTQRSLGEQYTLTPGSGAIAYMASTSYGFIDALHSYGNRYYELLGGKMYGQTIGAVAQQTIDSYQSSTYPSLVALLHQVMLQGDPAVAIHNAQGPDYVVDRQTVKINPDPIPAASGGTYDVEFDVVNIGRNSSGNLLVKVTQQLPNDSLRLLKTDTIAAPAWRMHRKYTFPVPDVNAVGYNRLLVSLDSDNRIAELPALAETNNELTDNAGKKGVEVYVFADNTEPVYPPAFSIVNRNEITLHAFAPYTGGTRTGKYFFELDTLETFNSPFRKRGEVAQPGGLLVWKPGLQLQHEKVYYWRVARDSLINGQVPWRNSSFVYVENGGTGWNQSHYGQLITNTFDKLQGRQQQRRIDYVDNSNYLRIRVAYSDLGNEILLENSFFEGLRNDFDWVFFGANRNIVAVMVTDPVTGLAIPSPPGSLNNTSASYRSPLHFFDTADSLRRKALMDFLENDVPNQAAVGIFAQSRLNDPTGYAPLKWAMDSLTQGRNLFQVLERYGARDVRKLTNYTTAPPVYGFIFRKGDPTFPSIDTLVYSGDEVVDIRQTYPSKWFEGTAASGLIGPVKSWKALDWALPSPDATTEKARIEVRALRSDLSDSLVYTFERAGVYPLNQLNAARFPYLKVQYYTQDTARRTALEPLKIRVLFEPLPEGVVHPTLHYVFRKDTVDQGEPLSLSLAFANISVSPMDSVLVRYRVQGAAGAQSTLLRKYRALPAGDTLHAQLTLSTFNLRDRQQLLVDVNPDRAQPELLLTNNVLFQPFYVAVDRRNPLLDVTFDGAHIMDGDLVSPKPIVVLGLKDDNKYLPLSDTSAFALTLVYPDGRRQALPYNHPTIQFFPAQGNDLPRKNHARLEWRPTFTEDGDYQLIVNGRDASGNVSGALDYAVNFKIITKSSISNLLNYPNPFSTSTCFVYTMTGVEQPAGFKVQIMTVSGKVVREVSASEFGMLKVGTHQSDFCWDGRDEFGDQLANGVYLYRVVAKKADGTPFDLFTNDILDGYFKHGIGKMVLIR